MIRIQKERKKDNHKNNNFEETFYCDYNSPAIKRQAARIADNSKNPLSIAEKSFLFVRDRIAFGFDLYKTKASETLTRGFGACWNKSLLLTALLRHNNIPAHFGLIPMKKTFFYPVVGPLSVFMNNPFNHSSVQAFINGKWIILDTVLDSKTYAAFFKPAGVKWGIDWNMKDDCLLYTESIIGPMKVYDDIDKIISRKANNTEFPEIIAVFMNNLLNKKIWKKAKIKIN